MSHQSATAFLSNCQCQPIYFVVGLTGNYSSRSNLFYSWIPMVQTTSEKSSTISQSNKMPNHWFLHHIWNIQAALPKDARSIRYCRPENNGWNWQINTWVTWWSVFNAGNVRLRQPLAPLTFPSPITANEMSNVWTVGQDLWTTRLGMTLAPAIITAVRFIWG